MACRASPETKLMLGVVQDRSVPLVTSGRCLGCVEIFWFERTETSRPMVGNKEYPRAWSLERRVRVFGHCSVLRSATEVPGRGQERERKDFRSPPERGGAPCRGIKGPPNQNRENSQVRAGLQQSAQSRMRTVSSEPDQNSQVRVGSEQSERTV